MGRAPWRAARAVAGPRGDAPRAHERRHLLAAFATFVKIFSDVDVCDRSTGLHDLSYRFDEDGGAAAPCVGCLHGCVGYWCLCRGCRALYCARESSARTRSFSSGCCRCLC